MEINIKVANPTNTYLVEPKAKLTRKKKRNPINWKTNVQKKLRFACKAHYTEKGKLKSGKYISCHYKCHTCFTKDQRKAIFDKFRTLSSQQMH